MSKQFGEGRPYQWQFRWNVIGQRHSEGNDNTNVHANEPGYCSAIMSELSQSNYTSF